MPATHGAVLATFSNCQAIHGYHHQVQVERSDDRPADVVESPSHMDHFGGQRALLTPTSTLNRRAVIISHMRLLSSSRRLELQRPSVVEFADMVPVSRSGFTIIGGMVAVNPVALEYART